MPVPFPPEEEEMGRPRAGGTAQRRVPVQFPPEKEEMMTVT